MGSLAFAIPSPEDKVKYAAWDAMATLYGFDWEAYTVQTDDEYDLTLFRMIGNAATATDAGKAANPLFFMHGGGLDATFWLEVFN